MMSFRILSPWFYWLTLVRNSLFLSLVIRSSLYLIENLEIYLSKLVLNLERNLNDWMRKMLQ